MYYYSSKFRFYPGELLFIVEVVSVADVVIVANVLRAINSKQITSPFKTFTTLSTESLKSIFNCPFVSFSLFFWIDIFSIVVVGYIPHVEIVYIHPSAILKFVPIITQVWAKTLPLVL